MIQEICEREVLEALITRSNMKQFISEPVPRSAGTVRCYILRSKNGISSYPQYFLHMEDFDDKFLLAAKKRWQNKTSNYLICTDAENLDRRGENYVGKLRSNFWGTEFVFCEWHGVLALFYICRVLQNVHLSLGF